MKNATVIIAILMLVLAWKNIFKFDRIIIIFPGESREGQGTSKKSFVTPHAKARLAQVDLDNSFVANLCVFKVCSEFVRGRLDYITVCQSPSIQVFCQSRKFTRLDTCHPFLAAAVKAQPDFPESSAAQQAEALFVRRK